MRANVDELLKKNADNIKKLRSLCDQELLALDKEQYDDIFLLRYVLTHKDEYEKAADCVNKTIVWRKENKEKIENAVKTGFGPNMILLSVSTLSGTPDLCQLQAANPFT